jgi:hypothetical protein
MLTSFEEWKSNKQIAELQVGDQNPINNRKIGQAFGDATSVANPKYMSYLKPRIDGLWRLNMYKAEKQNPGSTADPGRMRQLQDQFIKDLVVVITKSVRGNDAGGGRAVNFNRGAMNMRQGQMPTPSPQQNPAADLSSQTMGQGPQLK